MLIEERNTVVNDAHRMLLVVTDDKPINLSNDNVIIDTNEYYETTYYTDGLFRTFEENGKYINWYLINSKVVKEREVVKVKAELEQTKAIVNDLLMNNLKSEGAII